VWHTGRFASAEPVEFCEPDASYHPDEPDDSCEPNKSYHPDEPDASCEPDKLGQ
jgi:hypothetical protein